VRLEGLQSSNGSSAVTGGAYSVAVQLEYDSKGVLRQALVLDDEYADGLP
jgi:hypothetical protein